MPGRRQKRRRRMLDSKKNVNRKQLSEQLRKLRLKLRRQLKLKNVTRNDVKRKRKRNARTTRRSERKRKRKRRLGSNEHSAPSSRFRALLRRLSTFLNLKMPRQETLAQQNLRVNHQRTNTRRYLSLFSSRTTHELPTLGLRWTPKHARLNLRS